MKDDADVARVAAALNAPGLRYRSFNNAPVRVYSAAPRELLTPEPFAPPSEALVPSALPMPVYPEPLPAEPPASLDQDFEYATAEEAFLAVEPPALPPAHVAPPAAPPPAEPVPPPAAAAPLFSWPEVAPAAPLAPQIAPIQVPVSPVTQAPPAYAAPEPAPAPIAMQPTESPALDYRLFNAIGRLGDPPGGAGQPQAANTTLAMLRSRIDATPESPLPFQGVHVPMSSPIQPPPAALVPASAVTVPLSDVMRLIAAGAPPPASPFEAFRSALSAQPAR